MYNARITDNDTLSGSVIYEVEYNGDSIFKTYNIAKANAGLQGQEGDDGTSAHTYVGGLTRPSFVAPASYLGVVDFWDLSVGTFNTV